MRLPLTASHGRPLAPGLPPPRPRCSEAGCAPWSRYTSSPPCSASNSASCGVTTPSSREWEWLRATDVPGDGGRETGWPDSDSCDTEASSYTLPSPPLPTDGRPSPDPAGRRLPPNLRADARREGGSVRLPPLLVPDSRPNPTPNPNCVATARRAADRELPGAVVALPLPPTVAIDCVLRIPPLRLLALASPFACAPRLDMRRADPSDATRRSEWPAITGAPRARRDVVWYTLSPECTTSSTTASTPPYCAAMAGLRVTRLCSTATAFSSAVRGRCGLDDWAPRTARWRPTCARRGVYVNPPPPTNDAPSLVRSATADTTCACSLCSSAKSLSCRRSGFGVDEPLPPLPGDVGRAAVPPALPDPTASPGPPGCGDVLRGRVRHLCLLDGDADRGLRARGSTSCASGGDRLWVGDAARPRRRLWTLAADRGRTARCSPLLARASLCSLDARCTAAVCGANARRASSIHFSVSSRCNAVCRSLRPPPLTTPRRAWRCHGTPPLPALPLRAWCARPPNGAVAAPPRDGRRATGDATVAPRRPPVLGRLLAPSSGSGSGNAPAMAARYAAALTTLGPTSPACTLPLPRPVEGRRGADVPTTERPGSSTSDS